MFHLEEFHWLRYLNVENSNNFKHTHMFTGDSSAFKGLTVLLYLVKQATSIDLFTLASRLFQPLCVHDGELAGQHRCMVLLYPIYRANIPPTSHWNNAVHDGVKASKHFPHYRPVMRGIHRSSVDSRHKGTVMCRFDIFFAASLNRVLCIPLAADLRRFDVLWRHTNDLTWTTP